MGVLSRKSIVMEGYMWIRPAPIMLYPESANPREAICQMLFSRQAFALSSSRQLPHIKQMLGIQWVRMVQLNTQWEDSRNKLRLNMPATTFELILSRLGEFSHPQFPAKQEGC